MSSLQAITNSSVLLMYPKPHIPPPLEILQPEQPICESPPLVDLNPFYCFTDCSTLLLYASYSRKNRDI